MIESATSSKPGVYQVLWIGGMFLWGDKQKNWSSQVYSMFSGSVKSAQRHYKLQDLDKLAIEKREGQERSEERDLSEKN